MPARLCACGVVSDCACLVHSMSVLASCAAPTTSSPQQGTVTGTLQLSGGPAPGAVLGAQGEVSAFKVASLTGNPVATTKATANGSFSLSFRPASTTWPRLAELQIVLATATRPCRAEQATSSRPEALPGRRRLRDEITVGRRTSGHPIGLACDRAGAAWWDVAETRSPSSPRMMTCLGAILRSSSACFEAAGSDGADARCDPRRPAVTRPSRAQASTESRKPRRRSIIAAARSSTVA